MLMNDLIKMRIFELLSEASQEVTNDELQNAYGGLLEHIRCVSGNREAYDCRCSCCMSGDRIDRIFRGGMKRMGK